MRLSKIWRIKQIEVGVIRQQHPPVAGSTFDVIFSLNTKFFQIWSSVTGYGELCVCF